MIHLGLIPDGNRRWCKQHGDSELMKRIIHVLFQAMQTYHTYDELLEINRLSIYGLSYDNLVKRQDNTRDKVFSFVDILDNLLSCQVETSEEEESMVLIPERLVPKFDEDIMSLISEKVQIISLDPRLPVKKNTENAATDQKLYLDTHDGQHIILKTNNKDAFALFDKLKHTKIRFVGERHVLPQNVLSSIRNIEKNYTPKKPRFSVRIAMAYDPIRDIERQLRTRTSANIDVVFRSGGELRSSGFFPLQTMYSEWVYDKKLFPDCDITDIVNAVREFRSRNRRFGS